jgi:putative tricarboxylic transport membrane protein
VDSVKRIKITADAGSGIFWLVWALLVCYGASRLGLGSVTDPGSGFIFFWSGLILAVLALVLISGSTAETNPADRPVVGTDWRKVLLVLASLFLYALFLERIGFAFSTFFLLSFLLRVSGTPWPRTVAVAVAAAVGTFSLFELWLKIRLPKGIFGF